MPHQPQNPELRSWRDLQADDNSKRLDYRGKLRTLIHGASDAPHGGQILLAGAEAFDGIKTRLTELLTMVPGSPDYKELEGQAQCAWLPAGWHCPLGTGVNEGGHVGTDEVP